MVPIGKAEPAGTLVGTVVIPEQLSAAVGNIPNSKRLTTEVQFPGSLERVMSFPHTTTGAELSVMFTVKLQVLVLLLPSVIV